ncbi:MAG TPA: amidohydrolase family protein [Candidatus Binatia bacterium]|jgi:predicted TIM-barrel fold metal-dependent hydrolase
MIIDCDSHFMPPDAFDDLDGRFKERAPKLRIGDDGLLKDIVFPGMPPKVPGTTPFGAPGSGAIIKGLCDIEVRMADYEKLGIERHFILPQLTGWWSYLIEAELAVAMARSYNRAILRLMQRYPGKISGVALVPLQDVEAAIAEIKWAKANGFKAAALDKVYPVKEHPFGEPLGNRAELRPFFAAAEAIALPLFLHNVQHGHRASNFLAFQRNGLHVFAPQEGQMSLVSLITSGLLDEFPRLQFIFTENGTGWIKPLVRRLDKVLDGSFIDYDAEADLSDSDGKPGKLAERLRSLRAFLPPEEFLEKNKKPASHYFKKNFSFTIETEEPELPEAIEFLGAERFLFATDYPHDDPGGRMKFQDVELLRTNEKISEDAKESIRRLNAERLFG